MMLSYSQKPLLLTLVFLLTGFYLQAAPLPNQDSRVVIKAIGIPLADHYPGIVALEKYGHKMKKADFKFKLFSGPELVRAYFMSGNDADMAFNVSPMVIDMFVENPMFRWVSLIHRDGNAMAVNSRIINLIDLPSQRSKRKPDRAVAQAIAKLKQDTGHPVEFAIPSLMATHTAILYKYLKDNNLSFGLDRRGDIDVLLKIVKPPEAMGYIKRKAARNNPAAFEQSLPWAELAEAGNYGKLAWYSKDVLRHPGGHVECIIIARDDTIANKPAALSEVINFIHKAGQDIERARQGDEKEMRLIISMIRKHIPQHTEEAIRLSLRKDLNVINYNNLNVDKNAKWSLKEIMELSFEAGIINQKVDIEELADDTFRSTITTQ